MTAGPLRSARLAQIGTKNHLQLYFLKYLQHLSWPGQKPQINYPQQNSGLATSIQDKFAQLTWLSISTFEDKWVGKPDYNSPASHWNWWIFFNYDSCSRCIAPFDAIGLYGLLSRLELWDFFDYIPQPHKLLLNHLWNNDHHRAPMLTSFGGNRRQCYHPWCLILRDLAWNLR